MPRGIAVTLCALGLAGAAAPAAVATPPDEQGGFSALAGPPDAADALQTFNRDVYFLDHSTLRNPTADTPGEESLYSEVGALLPLDWGAWQGVWADSRVRTTFAGGELGTDVRLALSGLVPGGVYSVFYGTFGPDSEHPGCPGVERTLPLTAFRPEAQEPDPSSFMADESGTARYHGRADGALLQADQLFFSIVYHFDGRTYHPFPNRGEFFTQGEDCRESYGLDAMRHLLVLQDGFGA